MHVAKIAFVVGSDLVGSAVAGEEGLVLMGGRGGSSAGRVVAKPSASQRERRITGPLTTKGQERQRAILAAAREVFEERGYADARVADIVAKAKVAQGTFYTYFDSKEAVFAELSNLVIEDMLAALRGGRVAGTPAERITAGLRRFIAAFRPNAAFIGVIEQIGGYTPEMTDMRLALREAFVERSARGISQFQDAGLADPNIDPHMVAEVLGAMVDQTCYIWLSLGKDFTEEQVLTAMSTTWIRAIGLDEN